MIKHFGSFLLLLTVFVTNLKDPSILPKHYDLNQLLVVNAIGIDKTDEGDFSLTFAYADSSSASAVALLYAEGNSFASAVNNATRYAGRNMFLGHTRFVVLGHETAVGGLTDALNYLAKSYETRLSLSVVTVKGKAKDCLSVSDKSGADAVTALDSLLDSLSVNSLSFPTTLGNIASKLADGTPCLATPLIETVSDEEGQPFLNVTAGTAVYHGPYLCYELTHEDAYFYCLLREQSDGRLFTCSLEENGLVSVRVTEADLSFDLEQDGYTVQGMVVNVKLQVEVLESSQGAFDSTAGEHLEKQIEEYYTSSIEKFLSTYGAKGIDLCNFGDRVRRLHPGLYKTWPGVSALSYRVTTRCQIKISHIHGGHG